MPTPTLTPPTWTAVETLPEGQERVLAEHLRLTEMLAWRPDGQTWAVSWRQDQVTRSSD
jgi:hypothetical protein